LPRTPTTTHNTKNNTVQTPVHNPNYSSVYLILGIMCTFNAK
jgi:hypothetical protein